MSPRIPLPCHRPIACLAAILSIFLLVAPASAQTRNETEILDALPSTLARDLDLDGDVAAATVKLFGGGDALWIFEPDAFGDWQPTAELVPSDFVDGDQFGDSVAVDGGRVAAGAYNHDVDGFVDTGAIWIFERDPAGVWIEVAKATTTPLAAARRLGNDAIGLDGDVLAGLGVTGPNERALFVFERDAGGNWVQVFQSPGLSPGPRYLDLAGDTIVLGRPSFDGRDGEIRVYQRVSGAWTLRQTFSGDASMELGRGVAIDGGTIVAGSETSELRVYDRLPSGLFDLTEQLLVGSQSDIDLSGDRLAVSRNGQVDVYNRNLGGQDGYTHEVTLLPSDPVKAVGVDVSISGSRAVAELDDGTVGLFDIEGSTVAIDVTSPACTATSSADVTATVDSTDDIDTLTYRVGGGAEQTICVGCGVDPQITFAAAPLAECTNTVTVIAVDEFGVNAVDSVDVVSDGEPPTLDVLGCSDRYVLIPAEDTDVFVSPPSFLDNCDGGLGSTCDAGPVFPVGTHIVNCSRTDACGNTTSCTYTVTVELQGAGGGGGGGGGAGCEDDDFDDGVIDPAWTLAGIGNANQESAVEAGGVLELTADGATAFAGDDNAGFIYRSWTGDFRMEVTVDGTTMTTGGAFRKAGLMVRSTLDDGAPRVMAQLAPFWNNADETHLQFVARELQDGPGNLAIATDVIGVPRVVRLAIERRDDTFYVQYSTDGGGTWSTPGGGLGGHVVVDMPDTVLVGLDMVSNDISVTSTARFDDFEICPICVFEDDFDDGAIEAGWTLTGLGNANQESAIEAGGVLDLTADGATAFYGADNAGFLYRQVGGDFRMEVTIDGTTMTNGGLYRKAGLMVRQSLDPWDVRLLAQLAPFWENQDETHLQFVARDTVGGPGNLAVATDVIGVPRVLRLGVQREGDTLSVDYSTDGGATWIRPTTGLGGSITIPGLADPLLVGLDMVSNDISFTSTARFDDAAICRPLP